MNRLVRFKSKYDFSFLLKPLVILSFATLLSYILKVNDFSNADNIMLFCTMSVLLVALIRNSNNLKNRIIILTVAIILIIFRICIYDDLIFFLAKKCQNSGVKFGFLNAFFNTLGLNDFENLIYHTSYGGTKYIDGQIISGAIDIFKSRKGTEECAMFLSGKYLSLFAALGIALSLKNNKAEIVIITAFAIITGNLNVFLLTLLFLFPPYYFIFLLFSFVSFFICNLVDVNSGFYFNGSLFEMIIQKDNLVYLFAIGFLICAVSYYFSRLVNEKIKW